MINYYSYIQNYQQCQQPLNEILKIMDKSTFHYDLDITPIHHANYYITATLYALKNTNEVDLSKALNYLSNVITIIYRYAFHFDDIPPTFYEHVFLLVEAFRFNNNEAIFERESSQVKRAIKPRIQKITTKKGEEGI